MQKMFEPRRYWFFNTDETETVGAGKHVAMFEHQVIAAHGYCKGIGPKAQLSKPRPGETIFWYRADVGFVACSIASDQPPQKSDLIFGVSDEHTRIVEQLQVLPDADVVTAAEVLSATGQVTSYRGIVNEIHSPKIIEYLLSRFRGTKPKPASKKKKAVVWGGGWQPDPKLRRKVEVTAVKFVTEIYKREGWTVKSVERLNVGYDLHCTLGSKVECVEVKGTSGVRKQFMLTRNELDTAKTEPKFRLYVVTDVLQKPAATKYSGKQLIAKFDMTPLSYHVSPKTS